MLDQAGRTIDYIRISVTDRCNLRCRYCMPEEGAEMMAHQDMLSFEEIVRIARCGTKLGIKKIKLTGGEPLVRKDIVELVKQLREISGVEDITMTSNGCRLKDMASRLEQAGVSCINVSLDTLDRATFALITRRDSFADVMEGIMAAKETGLPVKINCAVMEDMTETDAFRFAEFARSYEIPVRFIEMMPIGQGQNYQAMDNERLLSALKDRYKGMHMVKRRMGNGPAVYYGFDDSNGMIGFISAVHHKFCHHCNRIRLTPDGFLKLCLDSSKGIDLRMYLRNGINDEELTDLMRDQIREKPLSHHFGEMGRDKHIDKTMNQIGG